MRDTRSCLPWASLSPDAARGPTLSMPQREREQRVEAVIGAATPQGTRPPSEGPVNTDGTRTLGCDGVPGPTCAWATQKPVGPQAEEQGWGSGWGWGCCSDQRETAPPPLGLSNREPRRQGVSSPTRGLE